MKIVSACLAGVRCNWQGKSKPCQAVIDLVRVGKALPVCPEQFGGLTTPREPAEQKDGRVFTITGKDVTDNYVHGAEEGLRIAQLVGCKEAILTDRSPSCGVGKIYDGSFTRNLIFGNGIFAQVLQKNGIEVISEEVFCRTCDSSFSQFGSKRPRKWYESIIDLGLV